MIFSTFLSSQKSLDACLSSFIADQKRSKSLAATYQSYTVKQNNANDVGV